MPETLDDLRAALRSRADAAPVPALPLDALADLDAARELRRRRAVALVAAAAVVVGVLTAVGIDRGRQTSSERPPAGSPSGLPTRTPATVEDLPEGADPKVAYLNGDKLLYGRAVLPVSGEIGNLRQAGDLVMFLQGADRLRVLRLDPEQGSAEDLLDVHTGAPGALDEAGTYAAWMTPMAGGPAEVVLRRLDGEGSDLRQTFPGTPSCCDNPFYVDGVSADGRVIASLPAMQKTWVWDALGDGQVRQISWPGFSSADVVQVLGNSLVIETPFGSRALGTLDEEARWTEIPTNDGADVRPVFDGYAVWSDDGRRVLFSGDGDVQVFDEDYPGNSDGGVEMLSMGLPAGFTLVHARHEDARHALLLMAPTSGEEMLLARCTIAGPGVGGCEKAASSVVLGAALPE